MPHKTYAEDMYILYLIFTSLLESNCQFLYVNREALFVAIPDSCQGPYPYIVTMLHVLVQLSAKSNLRNNSTTIIHDLRLMHSPINLMEGGGQNTTL